jgi:hypothetical protein
VKARQRMVHVRLRSGVNGVPHTRGVKVGH